LALAPAADDVADLAAARQHRAELPLLRDHAAFSETLPAARRAIARTNCRVGKIGRAYSKIVTVITTSSFATRLSPRLTHRA
jgi:hypothetical protein